MNTITVNNLSLGYKKAFDGEGAIFPDFSISAASAEMIALIGRNGIGKSTFLRTLVGLQTPLSGSLTIKGQNITNYNNQQLASLVSFVSTENIRIRNLKVFDLVALGRHPYTNWLGSLTNKDKELVDEAIAMVGIEKYRLRNINRLSDGELQRVMIARTLAQDTPIIILDEPTAFLDLPNKYEILLLLRRLAHQKNKTIIFSTHDLGIAMKLVDKIWLMASNHLYEGAPEDLALQGLYDELFENSVLSFNKEQGGIDMGITTCSTLFVVDANQNYWVKRALERLGYEVKYISDSENTPNLKVNYNNNNITNLSYCNEQSTNTDFGTLYDLIRFLRA